MKIKRKKENNSLFYTQEAFFSSYCSIIIKWRRDMKHFENYIKAINYRRSDAVRIMRNTVLSRTVSEKFWDKIVNFID